ncbi:MAG: prepilin-type N-terminal cleavage/methylation domain-containing protein [Bacilli bacterium]|nr:prepilin-type N-terminal cleavage/methylation domain-containing protein [Bacilli bacterium]
MKNLSIRKMTEVSKKKKKGFTLVELIIVIAIIAILAAMAIPKFSSVRIDAKVSNDVAAAKNIATITSTLIANGELTSTESITLSDGSDKAKLILKQLNGKISEGDNAGKSEAIPDGSFVVTVADDVVTVDVGDNELYPDNTGSGRAGHSGAAQS